MLYGFGARNFYSFKEGVEISLELGAGCPRSISKGEPVARLLCLKGANASGKTNALKIPSFLRYMCCNSFNIKPDDDIAVASFFSNDDPVDVYCEFVAADVWYRYEIRLKTKNVISETLYRKKKRLTKIIERVGHDFNVLSNDFIDLKKIKLRSNASFISVAHQYEINSINNVYNFFDNIFSNVGSLGRVSIRPNFRHIAKYYVDNDRVFEFAKEIIKKFDLGIVDIEISKGFDEKGEEYYHPTFYHDCLFENNSLSYLSQSLGTKTLFATLPYFFHAIDSGGVLIMDEFDTDYHPDILRHLIEMFDDDKINKKNAQMVFSTHNTDILDYMGKYRTYLFNKESCESYGYRLDEIRGDLLRNDRSIKSVYQSGKIGGVPKIKAGVVI